MAGEPVDRHHPNPSIDIVKGAGALAIVEVRLQRTDLTKRFGVVEDSQLGRPGLAIREIDGLEARLYGFERWRREAGRHEHGTERIDVTADPHAPQQGRLEHS